MQLELLCPAEVKNSASKSVCTEAHYDDLHKVNKYAIKVWIEYWFASVAGY